MTGVGEVRRGRGPSAMYHDALERRNRNASVAVRVNM